MGVFLFTGALYCGVFWCLDRGAWAGYHRSRVTKSQTQALSGCMHTCASERKLLFKSQDTISFHPAHFSPLARAWEGTNAPPTLISFMPFSSSHFFHCWCPSMVSKLKTRRARPWEHKGTCSEHAQSCVLGEETLGEGRLSSGRPSHAPATCMWCQDAGVLCEWHSHVILLKVI